MFDPNSFELKIFAGVYPKRNLQLPIFSPFVLLMDSPATSTKIRNFMMRVAFKK